MALGDWTRPIGGTLPFWSGLSTCTVWLSPLPFSAMPKRKTPRSALIRQWTLNSPCYRIDGETVFCQPCGKKVSRRVFTWRECFMCYSKPRPLDQVRYPGAVVELETMQSCSLRHLGLRLGVMAAIVTRLLLLLLVFVYTAPSSEKRKEAPVYFEYGRQRSFRCLHFFKRWLF